MEKGKWYKFDPYNKEGLQIWYMEYSDTKRNYVTSSHYIDHHCKYLNTSGTFHATQPFGYLEVSHKEKLWLEECVRLGKIVPIESIQTDEIINNYSIF